MEGSSASAPPETSLQPPRLNKQIGLFGLTMIAAGSCIGSGIFVTPSDIAAQLGNGTSILLVWLVGGIVAITGSLTFAELAGRFPDTGGVYVFIRESFGKLWAFLYGWCILTVVTSGAIAALSLTFARYVSMFVPMGVTGQMLLGMTAIIAVTLVNLLGVKPGEIFSSFFTVCKLLGIAAIILAGICAGSTFPPEATSGEMVSSGSAMHAYAIAMIGVLWSYGGWHHATYVASETKAAPRIVPRAMIFGTLIVTTTYVLANWAYLRLLPVAGIAASPAVAADAMRTVVSGGIFLVAGLIALSTFGSIGIYTLTAPRIYYTMAKDGAFFRKIAKISQTHHTPVYAILLQSGWAIMLLLLWTTFENLITYVVFMDWVFMILAAVAIFLFRHRLGTPAQGQFRTPGYPLVPLVFIGISVWFVFFTLIGRPEQAIAGLLLLLIGAPIYFLSRTKQAPDSTQDL